MLLVLAALVGSAVGSFLGLAAYRLPRMLEHRWQSECARLEGGEPPISAPLNLWRPASHCPACGHRLGVAENIPLLSWLLQRGRCRACGARIGWREPLLELAAATAAMLAMTLFGPTWQALLVAVFLWTLLLASAIDIERQWLPDELTLPLLWLGLLFNLSGGLVSLSDAVIGAAAGYLTLWSVYWAFRLATGREGMGEGDFKLLAAIGAWAGWQTLPGVVLLSSVAGSLWALTAIWLFGRSRKTPLPFGPALALGGAVAVCCPHLLADLFAP